MRSVVLDCCGFLGLTEITGYSLWVPNRSTTEDFLDQKKSLTKNNSPFVVQVRMGRHGHYRSCAWPSMLFLALSQVSLRDCCSVLTATVGSCVKREQRFGQGRRSLIFTPCSPRPCTIPVTIRRIRTCSSRSQAHHWNSDRWVCSCA